MYKEGPHERCVESFQTKMGEMGTKGRAKKNFFKVIKYSESKERF